MLPTKFRFIWPNGFRGEESKLEARGGHSFNIRPTLFKSLLWKQSANLKQTWHGWSLDSILSKLCPVTTTSIHRGEDFKTFFPIGSYVKTMFADGCHLGWRSGSQDIILKVDHLRTIHPMFALNSLDGHMQDFCFWCWSEIQHGCQGL
jgi:hypothetical protein